MAPIRWANLFACAAISACAPAPQVPIQVDEAVVTAAVNMPPAPYDTSTTIKTLMNAIVVPNAELLWNAVSYVVTEEGTTETLPDTDEEWTQLRSSAVTLSEAGNLLMIPGREVGEADPATAAFQYTPDEIAELITDDPQLWQSYAQQLQESTQLTLQAIAFRDVMGLQEFGAEINEACEGCHAQYWYRPQGVMAPQ